MRREVTISKGSMALVVVGFYGIDKWAGIKGIACNARFLNNKWPIQCWSPSPNVNGAINSGGINQYQRNHQRCCFNHLSAQVVISLLLVRRPGAVGRGKIALQY